MLTSLLGVARVNFLSLTLSCLFLAWSYSRWLGLHPAGLDLALLCLLALSAHVAVNALNEYSDYRSGLDSMTLRTPFSGGSGTLVRHPELLTAALLLALAMLGITVTSGLWLVFRHGLDLLLPGIAGVVIIISYTRHLNRFPLLCLLAPGLGFGLLMTLGAIRVLSGQWTAGALGLSLIITLLVSNVLLLNQFPDVEPDARVGRRHFPIVIGRAASAWLFSALHVLAALLLPLLVVTGLLPSSTWLALGALALLPLLLTRVHRDCDTLPALTPHLGLNVLYCHLYPLLLSLGLCWATLTHST